MITLSVVPKAGQMVAVCFIADDFGSVVGNMAETLDLVYAGQGSSHSWTWLADLFESRGIFHVRFVDASGFTEDLGSGVSRVMISGGDGFMIASSIGPHGFAHLKGHLHRGGGYVGICAGAYLPLHSSIPPFDQFNLSNTKIENLDCDGVGPGTSPRVAVRYGSCAVFHPVRGEVEVEFEGKRLRAPIYGGPIFREPERDETVLRYKDFTSSTEYQYDQVRARELMIGKPAGVRSVHGKGELLLLGPHLEHPRYREANEAFLKLLGLRTLKLDATPRREKSVAGTDELAKSLSDLKVSVLGLENRAFLVGNKLWDGSRFLELISAIEKRSHSIDDTAARKIVDLLNRVREFLVSSPDASFEDLVEGPELLVEAARICVDNHFAVMRENR